MLSYVRHLQASDAQSRGHRAVCEQSCPASRSRSSWTCGNGHGSVPVELTGGTPFPPIGELPYLLTLPGHGFYWFDVAPDNRAGHNG